MNGAIVIILIAIAVIGIALLVIAALTRGRGNLLDQEKYRMAWLDIENNLDKNNEGTYHFAILAADKLLSQALKESGVAGDKTSERLENAKKKFSSFDQVLSAHKIRNQIAHEADIKIDLIVYRRALAAFRKALKELGAI